MILQIARDGSRQLTIHLENDRTMFAMRDFHIHIVHNGTLL